MSTDSLLNKISAPRSYVTEIDYYVAIESHLSVIKSASSLIAITGNLAAVYQGDFDGLLDYLRIPKKYHYPIRRINGYGNSLDYDGEKTEILIPGGETFSSAEIDKVLAIYNSKETT